MFRRLGLIPVFAAVGILLSGCEPRTGESPANDSAAGANAANEVIPVDSNSANSTAGTGAGVGAGGDCGGIAGLSCSSPKEYCKMPDGQCEVPDMMGKCTERPEICTQQRDPVCGCDGKTYGNVCEAASAGVSVRARGECAKSRA